MIEHKVEHVEQESGDDNACSFISLSNRQSREEPTRNVSWISSSSSL